MDVRASYIENLKKYYSDFCWAALVNIKVDNSKGETSEDITVLAVTSFDNIDAFRGMSGDEVVPIQKDCARYFQKYKKTLDKLYWDRGVLVDSGLFPKQRKKYPVIFDRDEDRKFFPEQSLQEKDNKDKQFLDVLKAMQKIKNEEIVTNKNLEDFKKKVSIYVDIPVGILFGDNEENE